MAEIQGYGVRAIWAFGKVSKLGSGGRGWGEGGMGAFWLLNDESVQETRRTLGEGCGPR